MSRQPVALLVVGCYLWVMMILFGSIVLETFLVYPRQRCDRYTRTSLRARSPLRSITRAT
jgi:hypothetical protein